MPFDNFKSDFDTVLLRALHWLLKQILKVFTWLGALRERPHWLSLTLPLSPLLARFLPASSASSHPCFFHLWASCWRFSSLGAFLWETDGHWGVSSSSCKIDQRWSYTQTLWGLSHFLYCSSLSFQQSFYWLMLKWKHISMVQNLKYLRICSKNKNKNTVFFPQGWLRGQWEG